MASLLSHLSTCHCFGFTGSCWSHKDMSIPGSNAIVIRFHALRTGLKDLLFIGLCWTHGKGWRQSFKGNNLTNLGICRWLDELDQFTTIFFWLRGAQNPYRHREEEKGRGKCQNTKFPEWSDTLNPLVLRFSHQQHSETNQKKHKRTFRDFWNPTDSSFSNSPPPEDAVLAFVPM